MTILDEIRDFNNRVRTMPKQEEAGRDSAYTQAVRGARALLSQNNLALLTTELIALYQEATLATYTAEMAALKAAMPTTAYEHPPLAQQMRLANLQQTSQKILQDFADACAELDEFCYFCGNEESLEPNVSPWRQLLLQADRQQQKAEQSCTLYLPFAFEKLLGEELTSTTEGESSRTKTITILIHYNDISHIDETTYGLRTRGHTALLVKDNTDRNNPKIRYLSLAQAPSEEQMQRLRAPRGLIERTLRIPGFANSRGILVAQAYDNQLVTDRIYKDRHQVTIDCSAPNCPISIEDVIAAIDALQAKYHSTDTLGNPAQQSLDFIEYNPYTRNCAEIVLKALEAGGAATVKAPPRLAGRIALPGDVFHYGRELAAAVAPKRDTVVVAPETSSLDTHLEWVTNQLAARAGLDFVETLLIAKSYRVLLPTREEIDTQLASYNVYSMQQFISYLLTVLVGFTQQAKTLAQDEIGLSDLKHRYSLFLEKVKWQLNNLATQNLEATSDNWHPLDSAKHFFNSTATQLPLSMSPQRSPSPPPQRADGGGPAGLAASDAASSPTETMQMAAVQSFGIHLSTALKTACDSIVLSSAAPVVAFFHHPDSDVSPVATSPSPEPLPTSDDVQISGWLENNRLTPAQLLSIAYGLTDEELPAGVDKTQYRDTLFTRLNSNINALPAESDARRRLDNLRTLLLHAKAIREFSAPDSMSKEHAHFAYIAELRLHLFQLRNLKCQPENEAFKKYLIDNTKQLLATCQSALYFEAASGPDAQHNLLNTLKHAILGEQAADTTLHLSTLTANAITKLVPTANQAPYQRIDETTFERCKANPAEIPGVLPSRFNIFARQKRNALLELKTHLDVIQLLNGPLSPRQQYDKIVQLIEDQQPSRLAFWRTDTRKRYQTLLRDTEMICILRMFEGGYYEEPAFQLDLAAHAAKFRHLDATYSDKIAKVAEIFKTSYTTKVDGNLKYSASSPAIVTTEHAASPSAGVAITPSASPSRQARPAYYSSIAQLMQARGFWRDTAMNGAAVLTAEQNALRPPPKNLMPTRHTL